MGSSIALAAVAASLAVQPVTAVPDTAPLLKPSLPWNIDYAENMCVLQRQFGSGDQIINLGFKPGPFSEHMRMLLVRTSKDKKIIRGEARVSFDGGTPLKLPYFEFPILKRGIKVISIDLKRPDLDPLATAKEFRIEAGKQSFRLAPTVVPAAMKVLEACEKDLLVSWGMDTATVASIVSFPTVPGGMVSLFSTNDYPSAAIRNHEQGTAGVRFWVSKDGQVRDCKVAESSGSAILDAQTCAIITQRGRFLPARNAAGEAIESIAYQRVRWDLPGI